jgi:ATP-dependent DNA ligase
VPPTPLRFIAPCNPTTAKTVPTGDAWLHEPKLDGYRLQVIKEGRHVRLYSKGGYDGTKRLAGSADALAGLVCRSAVIDAEMCFLTGIGAPDFAGLQMALASRQCFVSQTRGDYPELREVFVTTVRLMPRRSRLHAFNCTVCRNIRYTQEVLV